MKKYNIQDDLNKFLEIWNVNKVISLIEDMYPLFDLYNVDEDNDWVKDIVGEDNEKNVRLIRTVYLLSKIARNHSKTLCRVNNEFKHLYKQLDLIAKSKEGFDAM